MREIEVARAIIINERDEVLLGQRANGPGRGKMELPGGKVDSGEKAEEASVREVYEEVGVVIKKPKLFKEYEEESYDEQRGYTKWKNSIYFSKVEGEIKLRIDPKEVLSAGFFSEKEITLFDMAFNQKDHVLEFLEKRKHGEI